MPESIKTMNWSRYFRPLTYSKTAKSEEMSAADNKVQDAKREMIALKKGKREGSALISTMIFTSLLFTASTGFLVMITGECGINRKSYNHAVALNLAEAGIDYAAWALPEDEDDTTADVFGWEGSNPKTKTFYSFQAAGGEVMGDFHVEVTDPLGDNPLVVSTGYVPGMTASKKITRTVKCKLRRREFHPFTEVFFGNEYVNMHGGVFTDSYDSRIGDYGGENVGSEGDVCTNGNITGAITLDGDVIVNGDAGTGPDGTVSGEANVTGEITHDIYREMPPVEVPDELKELTYWGGDGLLTLTAAATTTLEPGDYKLRRIKLTAQAVLTINGPARIYLSGYFGRSIFQTGSSQVVCNGEVEFYLDGDASLGGCGILNSDQVPSDCTLWGSPTCNSIDYLGTSAFYGTVYAGSAFVKLSGDAAAYGSFVGSIVDCGGGSGYHYDEALGERTFQAPGHEVVYWQEKE